MQKKQPYISLFFAAIIVGFGCDLLEPVDYPENVASDPNASVGGTTSFVSTGGTTVQTVTGAGGTTTTTRTSSARDTGSTSKGGSTTTSGSAPAGGTVGTSGSGSSNCAASDVIKLVGNKLYDTSGTRFVARGPELVVADLNQTKSIDAIAATGANAMRMLLTLDAANGMTQAGFDTLIGRAVSHKMVVWISLYTWDEGKNHAINSALGGGNFYALAAPSGSTACSLNTPTSCYLAVWSRQWLKDLMAKYKGHVIIDAMQEFISDAESESEAGRVVWATAAKKNIAFFRAQGYVQPLEIMSNFEGRDLYAIVQKGAEIRAADTVTVGADPQTMFGWQAYWASDWYKEWQGELLLGGNGSLAGAQAIHHFVSAQAFPIQVGIDNYSGDTASEYRAEIDQADSDGVSWLWWSWKDGPNNVECPTDGAACQSYVTGSNGFAGSTRSVCGL